jgi:transposase
MPKRIKLEPNDIPELERAMEGDSRPEVRQRAAALRALHRGTSVKDVALVLAVTETTIYNWLKAWQAEGVEGLANEPRPGRPRKADERYCRALEEAIEQDPQVLGYRFAIWTVERLRDHLKVKTGVELSVKHLGEVIAERGYVYRRPKHDLTNLQDPAAKASAHTLLEELKKGRSEGSSGCSLWTKQA